MDDAHRTENPRLIRPSVYVYTYVDSKPRRAPQRPRGDGAFDR